MGIMIDSQDFDNVRTWFETCERPLLIAHQRPDGDALGAMAGLAGALEAMGKRPMPALYAAIPRRYALLASQATWRRWDEDRESLVAEADAMVILDTCAYAQLEPIEEFVRDAPRTLVIDHHPTRDEIGTRPDDFRLIDDSAGAACLIVAEWLAAMSALSDARVATSLFVGIATDTGWFRHSNTDRRILDMAARLVGAGAAPSEIYRSIYEQEPAAKLRLIGRMLQTIELHADGRLAVLKLRPGDFAAAEADPTMTEDLVNEATRIGSTDATILFTEEADGRVRVNLRSKRELDVSGLARRFGGGGHVRAAGARPAGTWDEIVPQVIAAAVKEIE